MEHKLKRKYTGEAESSSITPSCSCGWEGNAVHAYNDYQYANIREQEFNHLRDAALAAPK